MTSPCKADDCERTDRGGLGYCGKHYQRLYHHGDANFVKPNTGGYDLSVDPETGLVNRFIGRIDFEDSECWTFLGNKNKDGYGGISVSGKWWSTHRYSYVTLVGEIPEGLELDHLCSNRACANPDHLEPITHIENVRRGEKASRTHCPQGHEYSVENTYLNKKGWRKCKICTADAQRRYQAKKRRIASDYHDTHPLQLDC